MVILTVQRTSEDVFDVYGHIARLTLRLTFLSVTEYTNLLVPARSMNRRYVGR